MTDADRLRQYSTDLDEQLERLAIELEDMPEPIARERFERVKRELETTTND